MLLLLPRCALNSRNIQTPTTMNPAINSTCTRVPKGDIPQTPEAGPSYSDTPRARSEKIYTERLLDSQLSEPSYRAISTVRSAIILFYIIAGNCLCSGFICLCLWRFSVINDLTQLEKRTFNALALLLSAALGFGIGFLFDKIGLFARGTFLQSKPHSVERVCATVERVIVVMTSMFLHFYGDTLTNL